MHSIVKSEQVIGVILLISITHDVLLVSSVEINQKLRTKGSALYPQASETRDVKILDGIWNFRKSPVDPNHGIKYKWFKQDLFKTGPVIPMPVPSSYNDIGKDATLRNHFGLVWYDRRFYVPRCWLRRDQRVWLRFGSIHYAAQVYVNGILVASHEIGHLPFETEITGVVHANTSNLLTVAVDNRLNSETVPQGEEFGIDIDLNITQQVYTFDFFNYAGIHRTVFLYSTPQLYIDDISVKTLLKESKGFVLYNVTYRGSKTSHTECQVQLFDKNQTMVASSSECKGRLVVANAMLWWPFLMHRNPGYLYCLVVKLFAPRNNLIDTYTQKIGIRTITWTNIGLFINKKPLYLRGFGMHEDSDMRGKGWDPVLWVKNFNLIRWVGANAFRTSHYPYAEEIYQLADEQGIMIIDECPSADTDIFTNTLLMKHKHSLTELIRRDKNHPSVIMWSVSNEPKSDKPEAAAYFAEVINHVKLLDSSRPVTIAISQSYGEDKVGSLLDVISINQYEGWYSDTGILMNIANNVVNNCLEWHMAHNKPVILSEYGADTIAGLHSLPEYTWSEEYQLALMSEHFKAFDKLRQTDFFIGEFMWNFADFDTPQSITRAGGNKKGIFTRSRQPKASAHHLRARYMALAAADSGATKPDTFYYVSDDKPIHRHKEL